MCQSIRKQAEKAAGIPAYNLQQWVQPGQNTVLTNGIETPPSPPEVADQFAELFQFELVVDIQYLSDASEKHAKKRKRMVEKRRCETFIVA